MRRLLSASTSAAEWTERTEQIVFRQGARLFRVLISLPSVYAARTFEEAQSSRASMKVVLSKGIRSSIVSPTPA